MNSTGDKMDVRHEAIRWALVAFVITVVFGLLSRLFFEQMGHVLQQAATVALFPGFACWILLVTYVPFLNPLAATKCTIFIPVFFTAVFASVAVGGLRAVYRRLRRNPK